VPKYNYMLDLYVVVNYQYQQPGFKKILKKEAHREQDVGHDNSIQDLVFALGRTGRWGQ
jgi:hypothetical protein